MLCILIWRNLNEVINLKKLKIMKNSLEEQNKSIVRKYWDGKWNERRPEILDSMNFYAQI
jgi:hypothetical protein